ncbi:hypothetical protein ACIRRA_36805 [Nocardia sp. NPDC101769]
MVEFDANPRDGIGALYYRLLISGDPINPAYADRIIDTLAPALEAKA